MFLILMKILHFILLYVNGLYAFRILSLVLNLIRVLTVSVGYYSRKFLSSKIKNFERYGRKFSNIFEMIITFISDVRNLTYEHYLNQPKSMLEWKLNANLAKNPELIKIKILGNSSHPLIRRYQHNNEDDGEN